MPSLLELSDSQSGELALVATQNARATKFLLFGLYDSFDVGVYLQATMPAYLDLLRLQSVRFSPQQLGAADGRWNVEAIYGNRQPGTVQFNFDTKEQKTKVTQSLNSTYYPAAGQPAINFRGAIEVRSSGGVPKVEGVDIAVPQFGFTVTLTLGPPGPINGQGIPTPLGNPLTGALVTLFRNLTGCVNSVAMIVKIGSVLLTFDVGELLFLGATGSQKSLGGQEWEGDLTLNFAHSSNLINATVAGIPNVSKRGWDYLWVSYEDAVDAAANKFIQAPLQVCVEQVYPYADLSPLF